MIEKLRQKIFMLIMISLSVIMVGVIVFFTTINYNNTINATTNTLDRFVAVGPKKNNYKLEDYKIKPEFEVDGLHRVIVRNSKIVQSSEGLKDNEINNYALEVVNKSNKKGIVGSYIYNAQKIDKNTTVVSMIEGEETILRLNSMIVFSIILCIIAITIIYIVSGKLSKMIVKPVEENFEKQKQFISDASHELKTPLAVIEANTDVLKDSVEKDNKWIGYIQNEIDSMNKLINELLLLAKVENIDLVKEKEKLDLSKEVEIILSMFESMAYEKGVEISSYITDNIALNANKEDIEHIVSTLVDNAIKHTDKDDKVIVYLEKDKNNIVLEVKNEGEEIPIKERDKIFERFYRIDKSRNRKEKRYGLGLAIAKSTVEKYNGKIEVDYKNGVTIFKVTIPN